MKIVCEILYKVQKENSKWFIIDSKGFKREFITSKNDLDENQVLKEISNYIKEIKNSKFN